MTRDESAHLAVQNVDPPLEPVDTLNAAFDGVIQAGMVLTSAIMRLTYADAACGRAELAHAWLRAESVVQALPEGTWRAGAHHDLGNMGPIVTRLLEMSPVPSPAAIEARNAGDETQWRREESNWIQTRRANRSVPRIPRRRFPRATRPQIPSALRNDRESTADAIIKTPVLARSPSSDPESDKAGR